MMEEVTTKTENVEMMCLIFIENRIDFGVRHTSDGIFFSIPSDEETVDTVSSALKKPMRPSLRSTVAWVAELESGVWADLGCVTCRLEHAERYETKQGAQRAITRMRARLDKEFAQARAVKVLVTVTYAPEGEQE